MEDDLQKRNTDCVYFLASPLTCKKGSKCDYRHSEIARLNPRDCWYWMSGNCVNPSCPFRHPPLDVWPEDSSGSVHFSQPLAPASKKNVPCFFYFNGCCNKGESCTFLHDPNGDGSPVCKSSKTTPATTQSHPTESKISGISDTRLTVETPHNLLENTSRAVKEQSQLEDSIQLACNDMQYSPSVLDSMPESEEEAEAIEVSDVTPLPLVDLFTENSDQSSKDATTDCVEPEELRESSPGFDVLVDDGFDQLGYEDDSAYVPVQHDGEMGRGLHNHLPPYDYEELGGYLPSGFPDDAGILYEHKRIYEAYECLAKDDYSMDYIRRIRYDSKELESTSLPSRELEVDGQDGVLGLRHRRRKRMNDGVVSSHHLRRRSSSSVSDDNRQRDCLPIRYNVGHKRLISEVGKNMIGLHERFASRLNRPSLPRYSRPKHSGRSTDYHREREQRMNARHPIYSSEKSRRTRPTRESATFSRLKSLVQIKEGKRGARREDESRNTRNLAQAARAPLSPRRAGVSAQDFEGPKPLSELLKGKKRLNSECAVDTSKSTEDREMVNDQMRDEKLFMGVDGGSGFDDDYDDEDDGLERKLAAILS